MGQGQGQVLKHEIESWMPSRDAYAETHSCSTLHEFKARRSMICYRDANEKVRYCHTLNNITVASPRILIPILENFQQADGSVIIPAPLRPYQVERERLTPGVKRAKAPCAQDHPMSGQGRANRAAYHATGPLRGQSG